ncbi:hybrid sensor histidine kinase/response regulator [Caulobacter sp. B11]|uniref:ATP-binding protein n=1 Tax=Caulobacter sp. B11 TaxID=2048899 RepID=UPI000C12A2C0|nr:ATP-binding protein [Caulobacter sp. B11]PHY14235.1 hybrid sensor histidine kinase/response regulator [Caulobacter sp. B11]
MPPSESDEARKESEALRLGLLAHAYRNSFATMVVQAATAVSVTFIAPEAERSFYLLWLAIVLTLLAVRLVNARLLGAALDGGRFARHLSRLTLFHCLGLVISAGLWAVLAYLRLPVESPMVRYTIIIVLSALAGGAVGVLASLKWTGRAYVTLLLLPASLVLISIGAGDRILGVLGAVFCGVMLVGHNTNYRLLVDSLSLRDENRDLLADVERRNREIERANQELELRVRERTAELEQVSARANAANQAKSQFLATISHEMRTPLNAILGEGQLMARDTGDADPTPHIQVIATASRALRQLIEDILDISQIEAGNFELRPTRFAVETFAEDIQRLYQASAQDHGLSLAITLAPGMAGYRLGDEGRLRQIVGNLVSNALKFTPDGGVTVEIGGDEAGLLISVRDTGMGIAPDQQEAIFQRFVQLDGSSTRTAGGIGLGLAICRQLADQMQGSLGVQSQPGQGAQFDLRIPMPAVEAPAEASPTEHDNRAAPAALLVVDDNPTNRRILAALLEPFGVRCGFATNGQEAIEAWRAQPWDMILMDIHMPGMDGVDAARSIRLEEAGQGLRRIPIIAVTASVLSHESAQYRAAGMDDVLAKPIETASLASTLDRWMGERPGSAEDARPGA